jgi:hypothetical protein
MLWVEWSLLQFFHRTPEIRYFELKFNIMDITEGQ